KATLTESVSCPSFPIRGSFFFMSDSFRRAVEAKDFDAMASALSPEVIFYSPIAFKPYRGRETTMRLFAMVMRVFEDFRYVAELQGEGTRGLVFRARIGEHEIEGWDYLKLDAAGRIAEFTVMVRPLSSAMALADAMGARLKAEGSP